VRVVATAGDGATSRFASSGLVELDELDDFELRLSLEPTARVALRPVFPEEHDEWTVVVRASSAPGFSDLWSRTLTVRRGDERPLEFHLPIGASLVAQAVPHGEEVAARVSAPEEVLDLPLPPLVSLSGSATGIDPLQDRIGLEDADGRHAAYARLAADGSFRFDGCPPGVYELFLYRRLDGETPLEHRAEVEVLATARVTANESRADLVLEVDDP
jgi:hypothetical protein